MYRIRLASGNETTYQSIDELTHALQSGEVTAEALIYHQRADRWLAITNHPHYQIALTRASSAFPAQDGSKRQVVTAVKPARPEVPPTVARAQLMEVVAEIDKGTEPKPVRKLTIPTPKKTDSGPIRAHENVLEGVVVAKTTVLPLRTSQPSIKPPIAPVPDLGAGLDLVEPEASAAPETRKPEVATPQVDKLLEMLEPQAESASPAAAPSKLADVEILDLSAPAPAPAPSKAPILETPAHLEHHPVQHPAIQHHAESHSHTRKSRGGQTLIGVGAAAVIVLAATVFMWKPWARTGAAPAATVASATLPRTEAFGGTTGSPAPAPSQPANTPAAPVDSSRNAKPVDSAPSIVRVVAPRNLNVKLPAPNLSAVTETNLSIPASTLVQRYGAAYNDARSELELRMLQIGFTQIFLKSRLSTPAGVQDTRRLIASASSALRQYRNQESQIERAYQDTVGVAGRNLGWTPRDLGTWNAKPGQKEPGETMRLTNLMLVQMDSVFSLLAEQEGKYQVSGEGISFDDTEATRQYAVLRGWMNQQADSYAGSADAQPATLRQVIKAIGATRLPMERRK